VGNPDLGMINPVDFAATTGPPDYGTCAAATDYQAQVYPTVGQEYCVRTSDRRECEGLGADGAGLPRGSAGPAGRVPTRPPGGVRGRSLALARRGRPGRSARNRRGQSPAPRAHRRHGPHQLTLGRTGRAAAVRHPSVSGRGSRRQRALDLLAARLTPSGPCRSTREDYPGRTRAGGTFVCRPHRPGT
jgi:hypothetical protein